MDFIKEPDLDFKLFNKQIKLLCPVYAGRAKDQKLNLIKIPSGTLGSIRMSSTNTEFNITYFLVKFNLDGQHYYARIAGTTFEFIN